MRDDAAGLVQWEALIRTGGRRTRRRAAQCASFPSASSARPTPRSGRGTYGNGGSTCPIHRSWGLPRRTATTRSSTALPARRIDAGDSRVCAIVERPLNAVEHKRLLLLANTPARTITALDEARVVASLINDDGLTPRAVANVLAKKPRWVALRLELATRLSGRASKELAAGRLPTSAAHALTSLSAEHQTWF